jgi:hypothetical protein
MVTVSESEVTDLFRPIVLGNDEVLFVVHVEHGNGQHVFYGGQHLGLVNVLNGDLPKLLTDLAPRKESTLSELFGSDFLEPRRSIVEPTPLGFMGGLLFFRDTIRCNTFVTHNVTIPLFEELSRVNSTGVTVNVSGNSFG